MKIDFSLPINDLSGNQTRDDVELLTLRRVAIVALTASFRDESPNGEESFKRYKIALLITGGDGVVDLEPEQISKIKTLIGKAWPPIVVGRAYEILNG